MSNQHHHPIGRRRLAALGAAGLVAAPGLARGQGAAAWPNRTITMVAPYPPGGTTDVSARPIATKLGELLGQAVVVENRAGAGGSIGAEYVARSRPDGYTILLFPTAVLTISPHIMNLPYDPATAFTPVAMVTTAYGVIAANPALPFTDAAGLVAYAKAHPGELRFGSAGNASVTAYQLRSSGGCFHCEDNVVPANVPGGITRNQPPVRNPYESIDQWISGAGLSPNSGPLSQCYNVNIPNGKGAATINIPATHGGRITTICNMPTVNNANVTINFAANGTYVFYGTDLIVRNGSLNCSGCTFIFTGGNNGAQTGDIQMNANGNGNVNVTLSAPVNNNWNPIFDGVAIYRDHRAPSKGNPEVQINGGQNVRLGGALLFPSADVQFNGNSNVNNNSCAVLVAGSITLTGNSGYSLASDQACAQRNTRVPQLQVVRLIE